MSPIKESKIIGTLTLRLVNQDGEVLFNRNIPKEDDDSKWYLLLDSLTKAVDFYYELEQVIEREDKQND